MLFLFRLALAACCLVIALPIGARQDKGPEPVAPADLQKAVDNLGNLDYAVRTAAGRTVRRTTAAQAVPALMEAINGHRDGYVRFRALVLLAGFNDPRARDVMLQALGDPSDRLREVAYTWFEHNPDPAMVPVLIKALGKEEGEFVRPSLVRALAAHASDAKVRDTLVREAGRGQDYFRSAVIEALGDYRAAYAVSALIEIAGLEGPLQDDAAVALGRIGDKRGLDALVKLQRAAPREAQPSIAAAICLMGVNCPSHIEYMAEALRYADKYPGYQALLRSAASGLAAVAIAGKTEAIPVLLEVGIPSQDPARAPIALALATVAIRNTPLMLQFLEKRGDDRAAAIELLREGFDMLEEDFEEERFFATVRRAYWSAPEGSDTRIVAGTLIQKLDF